MLIFFFVILERTQLNNFPYKLHQIIQYMIQTSYFEAKVNIPFCYNCDLIITK